MNNGKWEEQTSCLYKNIKHPTRHYSLRIHRHRHNFLRRHRQLCIPFGMNMKFYYPQNHIRGLYKKED